MTEKELENFKEIRKKREEAKLAKSVENLTIVKEIITPNVKNSDKGKKTKKH